MKGDVGLSNIIDNPIPKTTEAEPTNIAKIAIVLGDFAHCLAVAAGIIIKDINNKMPISCTEKATIIDSNIKKSHFTRLTLTPSANAKFSSKVIKISFDHNLKIIVKTNILPIQIHINSA